MSSVTIRRRGKKGTWWADVTDSKGKRQQFSLRTTDAVTAQAKRAELERQYLAGLRPERGLTVGQWVERWIDQEQAEGRATTTIRAYRQRHHSYVLPRIGAIRLDDLTIADVQRWDQALMREGGRGGRPLGVTTVRTAHEMLATALHEAMRHDLLLRNVAALARKPRAARREPQALSDADLGRLLNGAPDHPWRDLAAVAAWTGLRIGELAALRWDDLDFQAQALRVRRQRRYDGPEAGWVETAPKSAAGIREIPLGGHAIRALGQIRARRQEAAKATGLPLCDYIFCHWRKGAWEPFTSRAASRGIRELYIAVGLPVPTRQVHALRHTVATMLADEDAHPKVQQSLLGHANYRTTAGYTHRLTHAERRAAERVDARIGEGGEGGA